MRTYGFHRHMLLTRCDGLALGALLAGLFFDRGWVETHRRTLVRGFFAAGLAAIVVRQAVCPALDRLDGPAPAMWAIRSFAVQTGATCWVYFAIVGLVLLAEDSPRLAPLRDRRLVRLGTISYGIYLYHPFVLIFAPMIQKGLGLRIAPWMMDVAKVAACVGLAEVSWRLVERPTLRLKDRFPYASSAYRGPHAAASRSRRAGPPTVQAGGPAAPSLRPRDGGGSA
jgi:peptidoglycan/LPS O-acetylase OafA/YrhL